MSVCWLCFLFSLVDQRIRQFKWSLNHSCHHCSGEPHSPFLSCDRWASHCVSSRRKLSQHLEQQHVFLVPVGFLCQNWILEQGGNGRRLAASPQGGLHLVRVWYPENRPSLYHQIVSSWSDQYLVKHLQRRHSVTSLFKSKLCANKKRINISEMFKGFNYGKTKFTCCWFPCSFFLITWASAWCSRR